MQMRIPKLKDFSYPGARQPHNPGFLAGVPQTALIIGASRGLGLALAREWLSRGWAVLATVRGDGPTGLHETAEASGGRLTIEQLEMTDPAAVDALRDRLSGRELDLLFVNAGVANGAVDRVDQVTTEEFTRVMVTNALSPMRIVERLGDLVRPDGTIAVMSSSLGSVALNEGGGKSIVPARRLSALVRCMRVMPAIDAAWPWWIQAGFGPTWADRRQASASIRASPAWSMHWMRGVASPACDTSTIRARPCLGRHAPARLERDRDPPVTSQRWRTLFWRFIMADRDPP